jgi:hypothetical protein
MVFAPQSYNFVLELVSKSDVSKLPYFIAKIYQMPYAVTVTFDGSVTYGGGVMKQLVLVNGSLYTLYTNPF